MNKSFFGKINTKISLKYAINVLILVVFYLLSCFLMGSFGFEILPILVGITLIFVSVIIDLFADNKMIKRIIYPSLFILSLVSIVVISDLQDGMKIIYNQLVEKIEDISSYKYQRVEVNIASAGYSYYINLASIVFGFTLASLELTFFNLIKKYSYLITSIIFGLVMIYFGYFGNSLIYGLMILLSLGYFVYINNFHMIKDRKLISVMASSLIVVSGIIFTCAGTSYQPSKAIYNISETIRDTLSFNKDFKEDSNIIDPSNNNQIEEPIEEDKKDNSSSTNEGATTLSKVPYLLFVIITIFALVIFFPIGYYLYRHLARKKKYKKMTNEERYVYIFKNTISVLKKDIIKSSNLGYDGYYKEVEVLGKDYLLAYQEHVDMYYKISYGNYKVYDKDIDLALSFNSTTKELCNSKKNTLKKFYYRIKEEL